METTNKALRNDLRNILNQITKVSNDTIFNEWYEYSYHSNTPCMEVRIQLMNVFHTLNKSYGYIINYRINQALYLMSFINE